MTTPLRVAVVGLGKIAHDQHLRVISTSPDFSLVAAASPEGSAPGIPVFADVETLLSSGIEMDALILCQPPQFRFDAASLALRAGKHVMLEKPPGASTLEVDQLLALASKRGTTLFTAWHSRHAAAVETARAWLQPRRILGVRIEWREDVEYWHPNQAWIWAAGGLGVFDPGINALSILTSLLPEGFRVLGGTLEIPRDAQAPIAAQVSLRSISQIPVHADFDWRQRGTPTWTLSFETDGGCLELLQGGACLKIEGEALAVGSTGEYEGLYQHFARLVRTGQCDVDASPLRLVADAFMRCEIRAVAPRT